MFNNAICENWYVQYIITSHTTGFNSYRYFFILGLLYANAQIVVSILI